uniref:Uncharacterized protein n=1 Tax=Glossina austeni TaxID=7395 RepID=A0A1A9VUI9_GLOAU
MSLGRLNLRNKIPKKNSSRIPEYIHPSLHVAGLAGGNSSRAKENAFYPPVQVVLKLTANGAQDNYSPTKCKCKPPKDDIATTGFTGKTLRPSAVTVMRVRCIYELTDDNAVVEVAIEDQQIEETYSIIGKQVLESPTVNLMTRLTQLAYNCDWTPGDYYVQYGSNCYVNQVHSKVYVVRNSFETG